MSLLKKGVILFGLFAMSTSTWAQKQVSVKDQQWLQYYSELKFNKNWRLLTDLALRSSGGTLELNQVMLRTGIGYRMNPHLMLVGGVLYGVQMEEYRSQRYELRGYQEARIRNNYSKLSMEQRLRLEQRYFDNFVASGLYSDPLFHWRLRYRLQFEWKLWSSQQRENEMELNLIVADELFFHLGTDNGHDLLGQNRFMGGPTFELNDSWSFTLLYNYQYGADDEVHHFEIDHVIWLGIKHNIDMRGDSKR
ncbi:MAG: DUF2490 domain-containing protein [Bacteroidetes bacterium]|nr:MAG: DUF2490 domain-containing protein [Bacteroidota bacterium]